MQSFLKEKQNDPDVQHDGKHTVPQRALHFENANPTEETDPLSRPAQFMAPICLKGFQHYSRKTKARYILGEKAKQNTLSHTSDTFWMSEPTFRLSASATLGNISFGSVLKMNGKCSLLSALRQGRNVHTSLGYNNLQFKKKKKKNALRKKKHISTDVSIK